jgi:catechol 2,3-dioxygenase-like lactoylglutathione lyase family enzyme
MLEDMKAVTNPPKQLLRAMPVLDCSDFARSLAFYKEKLGFDAATWGEPVSFAIVQRGTVTLALAAAESGRPAVSRNWAGYVYVTDVDALYAELMGHGVAIAEPPETRPYNCREFVVDDPDGHMIAFGQVLDGDPLGPGLSERMGRDASEKPAP